MSPDKSHELLIVADFNAGNLASVLSAATDLKLRARCAPYGPVMQHLMAADPELWSPNDTAAIVWAAPHGISRAFQRRVEHDAGSLEDMAGDAHQFAGALSRLPDNLQHIFVPTFVPFHPMLARRGFLDMDAEIGLSVALMTMNLALQESARSDPRIRIFDAARWTAMLGEKSYDPRLWYAAKTPFSIGVFRHAAADFIAALRGLGGGARKVIVLDLDNTLWGGVVGDDGWEALRVGGHDAVGEAYRDFQAALKALSRRGILLGIASKNDEATALAALESHPEMILRPRDFAGWSINWNDKAANIVELIRRLNLGLDSVVFIDDNPVERDRIRAALPEVLVPDWPASPLYYCFALAALDCFDGPVVSDEDRTRTAMYVAERERQHLRDSVSDLDAWLRTLDITITAEPLSEGTLARAAQLLNKTNQMNLRTRRLSAPEFMRWAREPNHSVHTFKVTDRFGDYGLVGIGSFAIEEGETASIADFVLSCRVMGRQVEESMLCVLEDLARARGCRTLIAPFLRTAKNGPCLTFLEKNLQRNGKDDLFTSDLSRNRPAPGCAKIDCEPAPEATAPMRHAELERRAE